MFKNLISSLEFNKCYKIKNMELATYLNLKTFKRTPLTNVEVNKPLDRAYVSLQTTVPQATYKKETVMFHSIDDESLETRMVCNKCWEVINDTSSKTVLCKNCESRQLRINCTGKFKIQLRKPFVMYTCYWDVLKCILQTDISIGQNEEFQLYMSSNSFIKTHLKRIRSPL